VAHDALAQRAIELALMEKHVVCGVGESAGTGQRSRES
jgi:hypothetical protein